MKTVKFAKRWKHVLNATSYARFAAGTEAVVADHVAVMAHRDGVLSGEPEDAPAAKDEAPAKKLAKA